MDWNGGIIIAPRRRAWRGVSSMGTFLGVAGRQPVATPERRPVLYGRFRASSARPYQRTALPVAHAAGHGARPSGTGGETGRGPRGASLRHILMAPHVYKLV